MSGSHFFIPRNETMQPPYFQSRIIMFCFPIPTLILYIREIYICFQDRSLYFATAKYVTDPGNIKIARRHMNVEIGAEAAQFPEKEHINGIFNLRSFNPSLSLGLPPSIWSHSPLYIAIQIIGCYCLLVRRKFPPTPWYYSLDTVHM